MAQAVFSTSKRVGVVAMGTMVNLMWPDEDGMNEKVGEAKDQDACTGDGEEAATCAVRIPPPNWS